MLLSDTWISRWYEFKWCISSNLPGNAHTVSSCWANTHYLQGAAITNGTAISAALLIPSRDGSSMHQGMESEVLPCLLSAPEQCHSALSNWDYHLTGSKKAWWIIFIPKHIKMWKGTALGPSSGKPYFSMEEPSSISSFTFHITHCKSILRTRTTFTFTGKNLKLHPPLQERSYSQNQ